jgi:hypothetical protein
MTNSEICPLVYYPKLTVWMEDRHLHLLVSNSSIFCVHYLYRGQVSVQNTTWQTIEKACILAPDILISWNEWENEE